MILINLAILRLGSVRKTLPKNHEIGQTKYSYCLKSDGKIYTNKNSVSSNIYNFNRIHNIHSREYNSARNSRQMTL